jgi:hypothetical protein
MLGLRRARRFPRPFIRCLQLALQISKSCIFLNLGFFCCFDSSTTVSEQHVCKLVLAMECSCNEGSW